MLDINKDMEYILEAIDGILVVDEKERLVFMGRDLMDTVGVESFDEIKGKRLRDVISTNNTYKVLESGKPQIGEPYLVQGYTIISNAYPIYKGDKIIGALEFDAFKDLGGLQEFVDRIVNKKDLAIISKEISDQKRARYSLDNIKGSSPSIKKLKNEIKMASRSNSTVLVTGETGSGKEMISRAIHFAGHRGIFEFVGVNCASIPGELFESELFGYVEGSFTGAKKGGKKGLIEVADQGTIFLDEVNALSPRHQVKLLRFLQEKEIHKVGSDKAMPVDTRVIAASNENLVGLVEKGEFREDLYYRLNVIEINSPPLRNRRSDIPELVNSFIDELNKTLVKNLDSSEVKSIDSDVLKMLLDYDWPGNIRELHNVIERAMNRCDGNTLTMEHFTDFYIKNSFKDSNLTYEEMNSMPLKELKKKVELNAIVELLINRRLSIKDAANSLGISRQMLHKKIKEYDLKIPRDFS